MGSKVRGVCPIEFQRKISSLGLGGNSKTLLLRRQKKKKERKSHKNLGGVDAAISKIGSGGKKMRLRKKKGREKRNNWINLS